MVEPVENIISQIDEKMKVLEDFASGKTKGNDAYTNAIEHGRVVGELLRNVIRMPGETITADINLLCRRYQELSLHCNEIYARGEN